MKKNNKLMYLVIVLMIIGFAAVSTVLYINGSVLIGGDQDEFDVYYSNAKINGVEDQSVIIDDKHIVFEKTFKTIGETYVLNYDITNGSRNYDADVSINCSEGNNYISVDNTWVNSTRISSTETLDGTLTVKMIKGYTGEEELVLPIECKIIVNASEREILGEGTPANKVVPKKYVFINDQNNNGVAETGDEIQITGTNQNFYVISNLNGNIAALSKYNLYVGGDHNGSYTVYENPTGIQEDTMLGNQGGNDVRRGITAFATTEKHGINYYDYSGSLVEQYANNYADILNGMVDGLDASARIITKEELNNLGCNVDNLSCSGVSNWVYSTSYWINENATNAYMKAVRYSGTFETTPYDSVWNYGVRPVIEFSDDRADSDEINNITNPTNYSLITDNNSNGIADIGDEIQIASTTENFYVLAKRAGKITALSKYNLNVGGEYSNSTWNAYENPTGKQDSNMIGWVSGSTYLGVTPYSTTSNNYNDSLVKGYVDNYVSYLNNINEELKVNGRILQPTDIGNLINGYGGMSLSTGSLNSKIDGMGYNWIHSTSYWLDSTGNNANSIATFGSTYNMSYATNSFFGVRPVITFENK